MKPSFLTSQTRSTLLRSQYYLPFIPQAATPYTVLSRLYSTKKAKRRKRESTNQSVPNPTVNYATEWVRGHEVVDRKSRFLGWAVRVTSEAEVEPMVAKLRDSDRDVQQASHTIYAWRVKRTMENPDPDADIVQGFNNGGESPGGYRILVMLERAKLYNIVVVVHRWFGGTHIGSDRFRHISVCARDAITALERVEGSK